MYYYLDPRIGTLRKTSNIVKHNIYLSRVVSVCVWGGVGGTILGNF